MTVFPKGCVPSLSSLSSLTVTFVDHTGYLNMFSVGVDTTKKGSFSTLLGNDSHLSKVIKCRVNLTCTWAIWFLNPHQKSAYEVIIRCGIGFNVHNWVMLVKILHLACRLMFFIPNNVNKYAYLGAVCNCVHLEFTWCNKIRVIIVDSYWLYWNRFNEGHCVWNVCKDVEMGIITSES